MCDEKTKVDYFYDNGEVVKIAVDFGWVGDAYAREGYITTTKANSFLFTNMWKVARHVTIASKNMNTGLMWSTIKWQNT